MTIRHDKNQLHSSSSKVECNNYPSPRSGGGFYEIQVKGHLNREWSEWLEGMEMRLLENGEMILYGSIEDQAALMGLLNKLCRLSLTLISVNEVKRTN